MALSPGRLYRIEGRVQGVWFRESTREQAVRLGISGHALNLPDGAVEVLAFGTPEALAELQAWLQVGPPLAQVDRVSVRAFEAEDPGFFRTGWGEGPS